MVLQTATADVTSKTRKNNFVLVMTLITPLCVTKDNRIIQVLQDLKCLATLMVSG